MRLLNIISRVCARFGSVTEEPFGRLNVILVGYSHQFLPVAGKLSAPLYWPCNPDKDNKLKVLSMDDLIL